MGSSTITWIGRSVMRASYAAYPGVVASRAQDRLALRPVGRPRVRSRRRTPRGSGLRRPVLAEVVVPVRCLGLPEVRADEREPLPRRDRDNADVRFAPDLAPVEVTKTVGNPARSSGIVRPFPYFGA